MTSEDLGEIAYGNKGLWYCSVLELTRTSASVVGLSEPRPRMDFEELLQRFPRLDLTTKSGDLRSSYISGIKEMRVSQPTGSPISALCCVLLPSECWRVTCSGAPN
jgi:hypothetical protein